VIAKSIKTAHDAAHAGPADIIEGRPASADHLKQTDISKTFCTTAAHHEADGGRGKLLQNHRLGKDELGIAAINRNINKRYVSLGFHNKTKTGDLAFYACKVSIPYAFPICLCTLIRIFYPKKTNCHEPAPLVVLPVFTGIIACYFQPDLE